MPRAIPFPLSLRRDVLHRACGVAARLPRLVDRLWDMPSEDQRILLHTTLWVALVRVFLWTAPLARIQRMIRQFRPRRANPGRSVDAELAIASRTAEMVRLGARAVPR